MSNTIRIKRRANGGGAGAPSPMANAELAFNEQTDILYYGEGTGGANGSATTALPIGGSGAFMDLVSDQSVAGMKTYTSLASFNGADANNIALRTQGGVRFGSPAAPGTFIRFACDPSGSNGGTIVFGTDNVGTLNPIPKGSIRNLGTPTAANDAANKAYVDDNAVMRTGAQSVAGVKTFSDRIEGSGGLKLGTGAVFPASAGQAIVQSLVIDGGSVSVVNGGTFEVPAPTSDTHAANKGYVDSVARGLDWKQSVRAATGSNVTLSGAWTVDGVSVVAGDRVLVRAQSAAENNGIYVVASGAWSRASDFSATGGPSGGPSASAGATVFVSEGTTYGNTSWTCVSDDTITLGTTAINWSQVAGSGTAPTAANVGATGTGVYFGNQGNELQFRRIAGGTGVSIATSDPDTGTITVSVGSGVVQTTGDQSIAGTKTFTGVVVVPTPVNGTHAANKSYVDGLLGSVWLQEVAAATTDNITLSGLLTIDGVQTVAGTRVLVKNQSNLAQNGVYVAAAGAWTRATDFDEATAGEIARGKSVFVAQGTTNVGSQWRLATQGEITVGTTSIEWKQIGGAQADVGDNVGDSGTGLVFGKSGNAIQVRRIAVESDSGLSLTTPGNLNGSALISVGTIPVAKGGTGAIDASAARANLGLAIGTNVQPYDATLAALAGVTVAADQVIYSTGADAFAVSGLTSFGRSLIDDANASAARTTLGLESMSTQAASAVAITGGTIAGCTIDGGTF